MSTFLADNSDCLDVAGVVRFGLVLESTPKTVDVGQAGDMHPDIHCGPSSCDGAAVVASIDSPHVPADVPPSPSRDLLVTTSNISSVSVVAGALPCVAYAPFIAPADIVLRSQIGAGGFATVHSACWHGAAVAVKVFAAEDSAVAAAQVEQEAMLLLRLKHPNIVATFGVTSVRTAPSTSPNAIVLDCDGVSLPVWIRQSRAGLVAKAQRSDCPPHSLTASILRFHARLCDIFVQIASALWYCHAQTPAVVHRDVKPGNIVVATLQAPGRVDCKATLVDFGAALVKSSVPPPAGSPSQPRIKGTARYLAPEAWRGVEGCLTPAVDIYGLGATLLAAVTGKVRWEGQPAADVNSGEMWRWIRAAVLRGDTPVFPLTYNDHEAAVQGERVSMSACPVGIVHVVQRCLAYDAAARPCADDVGTSLAATRDRLLACAASIAGSKQ